MQRASAAYARGDLAEAERWCRLLLAAEADHLNALNLLGVITARTGRPADAAALLSRVVALRPDVIEAHVNLGHVLQALRRFDEAQRSYANALRLRPDDAEVFNHRGIALRELHRFEEALENFSQATLLGPEHAEAQFNRGHALRHLQRFAEAEEALRLVLRLRPDLAEAHNNLGLVLHTLRRFDEALRCYEQALHIRPDYAEACNNRGNTLQRVDRREDALESYGRALRSRPDYVEALSNRGSVLKELRRFEEAVADFERAQQINPDLDWLPGTLLYTRAHVADWREWEPRLAQLRDGIEAGRRSAPPFAVLSLIDEPALQRRAAQRWVAEHCVPRSALPPMPGPARRDRIHIGYFSADFRDHPVSVLAAELFETHDRNRFEISAFSFGPDTQDGMRKRLEGAFDHFVDVRDRSDEEIAQRAREMRVDIAVDLMGHTEGSRPNVFALRAAPLQVGYLGYPGTSGAPYMDYLLADAVVVPPHLARHYSERIAYLPGCYLPHDSRTAVSEESMSREECGLPRDGFVFCCFNNSYKISPRVFALWLEILKRVPGSVLWLSATHTAAAANLRRAAVAGGVAEDRLIFANRAESHAVHLGRQRLADLFLDTLPYNAHTTASDALWAGLPVITRAGESFAGRVAASLLTAIGLPELVTTTPSEYADLAVALAQDASRLGAIRERVRRNRLTTALFDPQAFILGLEAVYQRMCDTKP